VCAHLLELLKTHDGKRLITRGQHSKITACSLPEWLPADIVKMMIMEFGGRLRKELVELQKRSEVLRLRASSNDTQRMSQDSTMPIMGVADPSIKDLIEKGTGTYLSKAARS
jgi:hypothetical protein